MNVLPKFQTKKTCEDFIIGLGNRSLNCLTPNHTFDQPFGQIPSDWFSGSIGEIVEFWKLEVTTE